MSETPPTETGAPAEASPEGNAPAQGQVEIALGPHTDIYPESLRPAAPEPTPAPLAQAPEPESATVSEAPEIAGPEPPPDGETRGTRRRAAEDAYQRGLTEGRAALEREQAQQAQANQIQQTQREATERVEQLFNELASPDYATQDRARQGILQMYSGNRQAAALMQTTRQQVLSEMAADFRTLGQLDGIDETGYQSLHTAPSAAELAKRAFDLGKKARDDQVARLEAEVEGLRGRLVGSKATPEPRNGSGNQLGGLSIEQYLAMSPKEAAKLSSAQIDAITAEMATEAARNGR